MDRTGDRKRGDARFLLLDGQQNTIAIAALVLHASCHMFLIQWHTIYSLQNAPVQLLSKGDDIPRSKTSELHGRHGNQLWNPKCSLLTRIWKIQEHTNAAAIISTILCTCF